MIKGLLERISSVYNNGHHKRGRTKKIVHPTVNSIRNNGKSTAILFIHGFTGNSDETWSTLLGFIGSDPILTEWDIYSIGYSTRLIPDISGVWSADAPIDTLSKLFTTIIEVPPLKRYECLSIVAHSMGGLVVQKAILSDSFVNRISHVSLFGTPSLGLKKVGLAQFFKRQLRDMKSNSAFISSLRSEWNNRYGAYTPFKFITVHGETDEFVSSSSSIDPFPLDTQRVIPGNHSTLIKPDSQDSVCVQLIVDFIAEGALSAGPLNSALIAVERGKFRKAIKLFEPHVKELDTDGLVQYALALEGVGRREDALSVLELRRNETGTDGLGTLAGRFKRRWKLEHREQDGEHALSLYKEAYERANLAKDHSQAYYLLINVVYMMLTFKNDIQGSKEMALKTLEHCAEALQTGWNLATEGEANLVLGNTALALEKYTMVVQGKPSLKPRELQSMFGQAAQIAVSMNEVEFEAELTKLFSQIPEVIT